MGGNEIIIQVHPTMDMDRLEVHGETRDIQPVLFHHKLPPKMQEDSTNALDSQVITIGSANSHVGGRIQRDEVQTIPTHTVDSS